MVIDCRDCDLLASFWSEVLGGTPQRESEEWVVVRTPDGSTPVSFQRVPEDKHGKNRVHLDVAVPDLEAAAERCVQLGATRLTGRNSDPVGDTPDVTAPQAEDPARPG